LKVYPNFSIFMENIISSVLVFSCFLLRVRSKSLKSYFLLINIIILIQFLCTYKICIANHNISFAFLCLKREFVEKVILEEKKQYSLYSNNNTNYNNIKDSSLSSNLQKATSHNSDSITSKVYEYETSVWIEEPYPNPATTFTNIPIWFYSTVKPEDLILKVYTIFGIEVVDLSNTARSSANNGHSIVRWDLSTLSSGLYLLKADSKNRLGNSRIIIKN